MNSLLYSIVLYNMSCAQKIFKKSLHPNECAETLTGGHTLFFFGVQYILSVASDLPTSLYRNNKKRKVKGWPFRYCTFELPLSAHLLSFLYLCRSSPLSHTLSLSRSVFLPQTVWKFISFVRQCQNVPLFITDMVVIHAVDQTEKVSLCKFVIKQGRFFFVIYHKPLCSCNVLFSRVQWFFFFDLTEDGT